jgi:hypothetical protein
MKLPDYITCIAEYYENNMTKDVVMRSIAIVDTRNNKLVVSRYYDLSDYSDDEACDEIDSIVGDFKNKHKIVDILYSNEPIPVVKNPGGGYVIKLITVPEYIHFMRQRSAHGS